MKYIIYCRKSTDSEDRQVMSLESQENEMLQIAKKNNLEILEILHESKSAKSLGRPVFAKMMDTIQKGKAQGIICWKLDRLARNFVDGGLIIDCLQKSIIKEIRTYESVHYPNETVFLLAMQFGMANQYSRDLSTNVKRGLRTKLENGGWPNKPPLGYLNDQISKKIIIDKKFALYVVRAYELYLTGGYTLQQISKILYNEGLRTKTGGMCRSNQIHRFFLNRFYCGMMERDGKIYNGNHKAIISVS